MNREHRHLVLVGLMGAGKTTVGRRCAQLLGRDFVDTDDLVEATVAHSVAEIFREEGEARFRELERVAVADAAASPRPLVIACGGGAVLDAETRSRLRATGVVVWLRADPSELGTRVADTRGGAERPLLADGGSAVATLARLATLREPAYDAAAHVVVDTDTLTVDDAARRVIEEFQSWNG